MTSAGVVPTKVFPSIIDHPFMVLTAVSREYVSQHKQRTNALHAAKTYSMRHMTGACVWGLVHGDKRTGWVRIASYKGGECQ